MPIGFSEGQVCIATRDIDLAEYGAIKRGTRLRVQEACAITQFEPAYVAFTYQTSAAAVLVGDDLDSVSYGLLATTIKPAAQWLGMAAVIAALSVGFCAITPSAKAHHLARAGDVTAPSSEVSVQGNNKGSFTNDKYNTTYRRGHLSRQRGI